MTGELLYLLKHTQSLEFMVKAIGVAMEDFPLIGWEDNLWNLSGRTLYKFLHDIILTIYLCSLL